MMTKTLVFISPAATGCLSLRTHPDVASLPDNLLTLASSLSRCQTSSDSLLHLFTLPLLPGLFMMVESSKRLVSRIVLAGSNWSGRIS